MRARAWRLVQGEGLGMGAAPSVGVRPVRMHAASSPAEAQLRAHARRRRYSRAAADGIRTEVRPRWETPGRDDGPEEVGFGHKGLLRGPQALRGDGATSVGQGI